MKKVKLLFIMLFAGMVMGANAQAPAGWTLIERYTPAAGELGIAYEKWQMANGLTVILHEDHSDPIVHVEMTYKVGSNRESMGKSGFAHFFEHMMFQGSKNVADEEHFKIVQGAGGQMNGTTNSDRTNYFETLPSNMLETALWLEADRMGFLLDSVTQKKFEVQRATVKNEKSQNIENQPYAMAFVEIMGQTLYPQGHPYSWPVIGYVEDLNSVSVDDLKNFFLRWYGPNNAILVIAGDIKPSEVFPLVDKYFAPIKKGKAVSKMKVDKWILPSEKHVTYPDNVYFHMDLVAYPTVPNYDKDEPALDMLAEIFGGNINSPLYQNFVKTEKAVAASSSHPCRELGGEFMINIFYNPKYTQKEIEDLLRKTINEFDPTKITDDQLLAAKTNMEANLVRIMESVQGKASQLTNWTMLMGNKSYNLKNEVERYKAVTKEDIARVFDKYIKSRNAAFVHVVQRAPELKDSSFSANPYPGIVDDAKEKEYVGLKYEPVVDNFDRSQRPAIAAAVPANIPQYYKASLPNGIKILGTQTTEVPTVDLVITIKGGHQLAAFNPKKVGLARLTAEMMNEGTKNRTAEQLEAELNKLGASIFVTSGRDNTQIYVSSLDKNIDATLKLLEDVLMNPRFDEKDFKRVKNQAIDNYYTEKTNAALTASKAFNKVVYGEDHIFGAYFAGTNKSLDNISLEDVKEFYKKYYSPSLTTITVVGNVNKDVILPKLDFLKKWEDKKVVLPKLAFDNKPEKAIYMVDKINAPQSQIRMGYLGEKFDYKGDFFKTQVMNFPLGGNFNSRINLNLREDKGWTYGARTSYSGGKHPGVFMFTAGIRTSATDSALKELIKDFENFKKTGITESELAFTKTAFMQGDALNYESSFQKAGFLNLIETYNLPENYLAEQNEVLKSLTKAEVDALAMKIIDLDKMVIVVVGDEELIKDGLKKLGYKIKTVDPDKISVKEIDENENRKVVTEAGE
ncbi:MAG TPA: pitrilysin family protein [Bacteroidia bacterium]|nr:pitrilysin family protein [Bacteroidia bacterium]